MIVFFAALTVLDALVLWFVIAVPGSWIPRAVAVLMALFINVTLLLAVIPDGDGKATSKPLPAENEFIACVVAEPVFVYFWALVDAEPRGFRVPYTRSAHTACEQAREAQSQGLRVGLGRPGGGRPSEENHPGQYVPYVLPPVAPPKS